MRNITSTIIIAALTTLVLLSCKKEGENIFNMFNDVEITLHDKDKTSITGYKEVMDGDSVTIDFTVTSKKEMYAFCLLEVGQATPVRTELKPTERTSYSGVFKMKVTKSGKTSYRIYPLDRMGFYMGDGGILITIDVVTNISFFNERILRPGDALNKTKPCFMSLATGELFSYDDIAANTSLSSKIDFGVYSVFVPEVPATGSTAAVPEYYRYYLYSLSKTPSPFPAYDLSGWSKRTTVFSNRLTTGSTDFDKVTGGSTLATLAAKVTIDQSGPIEIANSAPSAGAPVAAIGNSYLYFKTPEGKYGALYMSSAGNNYQTGRYLTFQIKVQK